MGAETFLAEALSLIICPEGKTFFFSNVSKTGICATYGPLRIPKQRRGFPGGTSGKELACQCRRHKKCRFDPWVKKIPWRKAWHPTPLFLPGESHRQRRSAAVHGVAQSRTRSKQLSTHAHKQLRTNDVVRERGAHRRGSGGGQRNLD